MANRREGERIKITPSPIRKARGNKKKSELKEMAFVAKISIHYFSKKWSSPFFTKFTAIKRKEEEEEEEDLQILFFLSIDYEYNS